MICPHCHTENRSGAKFCDECGTRLVAENAPEETQADSKALEGLPNISASGFGMTTPERAFSYEPVDEFNDDEPVAQQEIADEIDDALPLPESEDNEPHDEVESETKHEDSDVEEAKPEEDANEPEGSADDNAAENGNNESDDAPKAASLEASETCDLGNALSDLDIKDNDRTHVLDIRELRSVALEAEKTQVIGPKLTAPEPRPTTGADLSGFDEFLVNPGYVPPKSAWSAGDTTQMPRIEGVEPPKQKDFKAPDARKSHGRGKKAAIIIALVLVLAAAAAAGVTYYLEMWGGKVIPDVTGMTQSDATYLPPRCLLIPRKAWCCSWIQVPARARKRAPKWSSMSPRRALFPRWWAKPKTMPQKRWPTAGLKTSPLQRSAPTRPKARCCR